MTWGLGFLESRVHGWGFCLNGLGYRGQSSRWRVYRVYGQLFRVQGLGFRVYRIQVLGQHGFGVRF